MKHPLAETHVVVYQLIIKNSIKENDEFKNFLKEHIPAEYTYSLKKLNLYEDEEDALVKTLKVAFEHFDFRVEEAPTIVSKKTLKRIVPVSEDRSIQKMISLFNFQDLNISKKRWNEFEILKNIKSVIVYESGQGNENELISLRDPINAIDEIPKIGIK